MGRTQLGRWLSAWPSAWPSAWLRAASLAAPLLAAGCGGPPPPPPTIVNVTIKAAPDVNPGTDGQGAPLDVRLYQLGSQAGFTGAEFYPLYNSDAATLGTDLVKRDDYLLAPGQTRTVTLMPRDDVKAIGVFGAYRAFQSATWRAAADIPAHQTTNVTIAAGAKGVTINAVSQPPAKTGS